MADYVNNLQFLEAIKEYRNLRKHAEENNLKMPQIPNYIGECILQIATHLSYKYNFLNYTYKDEMISDGIENCITYLNNFDPDKSSNPFAYFTQVIYYAFIRRIQREKKQSIIKGALISNICLSDEFEIFESQIDDEMQINQSLIGNVQNNNPYIKNLSKSNTTKRRKLKEKFIDKEEFNTSNILEELM